MTAVVVRLRAELRASRWSWATIALLIGLIGGVSIAAAAGAHRTDTAYPRLLRSAHAADVLISPTGTGLTGFYDKVAQLPEVDALVPLAGLNLFTADSQARGIVGLGSPDPRLATSIERLKITSGRLYDPTRAEEAVADRTMARALHLQVGQTLELKVPASSEDEPDLEHARRVQVRIVGVGVTRDNVVPVNSLAKESTLLVSPAFIRQFDASYLGFDGALVRLRPGASVATLRTEVDALAPQFPDTRGEIFFANQHVQAATVQRAIRPQAATLALLGLFTALAGLLVLGQVASRQLALGANQNDTLRALGYGRTQFFAIGLLEVATVAAAGAVLAAAIAIAASRFTPIGYARIAEPHPGLTVDWPILGVGALLIVVLLVGWVAWPAWRIARVAPAAAMAGPANRDRPSRVLRATTRASVPVSAAIGVRMALTTGRGKTAVPVRSALLGAVVAVAALAGALTFGTNLVRLIDTPRLYGQTWDLALDSGFGALNPNDSGEFITRHGIADAWTFGDHGDLSIGGHQVSFIGLAPGEGSQMWPTLLEGRTPRSADEILLGTKTLRQAHRRVGETVDVVLQGSDAPRRMRIVGRAVFPYFGRGSFTPTGLGDGAALPDPAPDPAGFNIVLMHYAAGHGSRAEVARFRRDLQALGICPGDTECGLVAADPPLDVVHFAHVRKAPFVLATVLALLAVATVAHVLVTSIRRRRRDMAVLKALGFRRGQLSAAVAWQSSILVGIALLIGLPLGVAGGRSAWRWFASWLGVGAAVRVPLVTLLLAVPIGLVIANALATLPARTAGRLKPAAVFRVE